MLCDVVKNYKLTAVDGGFIVIDSSRISVQFEVENELYTFYKARKKDFSAKLKSFSVRTHLFIRVIHQIFV